MLNKITFLDSWKNLHANIYTVSFTLLINLAFFFTWWGILPLYFRQLGANDFEVALCYAITGISYTLFQFIGGILGDRFGRKFIIVAATLTSVPLYIIAAMLKSWMPFLIVLSVGESLSALQAPCFISIVGESSKSHAQGKAFSLFEASITLGLLLGPAFGAVLVKFVTIPVLIIASGVICFFTGIARWAYLKETIHTETHFDFRQIRRYLNKDLLWLIAGLGFLSMIVGLTIYGPFLAIYAKDFYFFSKSQINVMFALAAALAVILGPAAGHWVDRFGLRRFLIGGAVLHAVLLLFWTKAGIAVLVFVIFALSGIPLELAFIAKSKFLTMFTPKKYRATLLGLIGAVAGIMGASAPILGKLCQNWLGKSAPFILALIFALMLGICLLQVRPRECPE